MSRGLSELPSTSAFEEFPAGHFFYSNLRIQETLTTIRYGIEARKGVVLITGEPGVGKTTLLHEVAIGTSTNVTCILESDPRADFTEVLRLMLSGFGLETAGADEQAMVRSCQRELRARLKKCQIVALMFDNAQHLSEQTLRHVAKSFLGGSAEDPDGTLLQLVLVGQPELKIKFAQAALSSGRGRTPIFCEIQPLDSQEIGSYIDHRLRANEYPTDLFDARVVKRIALYSKGNPRSVDAICERAVQVADGSAGAAISVELIDGIARELHLHESAVANARTVEKRIESPAEIDDSVRLQRFQFAPSDDYRDAIGRTFMAYGKSNERQSSAKRPKRRSAWLSVMLLLIVISGTVAWVGMKSARESLTYWSGMAGEIIARLQSPQTAGGKSEDAMESMAQTETREPLPSRAIPAPPEPDQASNVTQTPPERSLEPPSENLLEPSINNNGTEDSLSDNTKSQPQASFSNLERRAPLKANAKERSNQDLQLEIIKAIESRAIMGVEVSVVGGIVYLRGHVPTERQRRAAERAARSVSDATQIYNRIVVD